MICSQEYEAPGFAGVMSRIQRTTDCRTQVELAALLGIRQSSISDAKRRSSIPGDWLVLLLRLRGVSPEWIMTGCGPQYLVSPSGVQSFEADCAERTYAHKDSLRCFSTRELADELVRRATGKVKSSQSPGEPQASTHPRKNGQGRK